MKPKTLNDAKELANLKNGKCLANKIKPMTSKLLWECEYEHKWKSTFYNIQRGRWCPYCAGKIKKTLRDAKKLAKSKFGKCLSKEYINCDSKMAWKCKYGHTWEARYFDIKKHWCPYCANRGPKTIKDAQELAKSNNGECLSKEYINSRIKMEWKCENGHIWKTKYNKIQQGQWCPECKNGKSAKKLKNILKSIFNNCNILDGYNNFDFLYNNKTKGKQHLDILIIKNNKPFCAVEYDGEQHFRPVNFGNKFRSKKQILKEFNDIRERDHRKNKLMREYKNIIPHFIRIKYNEKLTKENIRNILIKESVL